MANVTFLQSALQLPPLLNEAALSVVLLTAYYSLETRTALAVLDDAHKLISCPYPIAYYQVELSPQDIRPVPDQIPLSLPLQAWQTALIARNITSDVPWFPCLRLVRNDGTFETHLDSWQAGAIANHIQTQCGSDEGVLGRVRKWTTPVSKDRFAREILREEFRTWGMLVLVKGGVAGIGEWWDGVARAIEQRNREGSGRWVASILDVEKEPWAAKYGEEGLLFVDGKKGRVRSMEVGIQEDVYRGLVEFEEERESGLEREGRFLRELKEPKEWTRFLQQVCLKEEVFWILVYKKWCGFSQRILQKWRRVAERGSSAAVNFVEVEDVEDLPTWIEKRVDGYPTVLKWSSLEGVETIQEWFGPIGMDMLEELHLR